ncbi:hypothetical protein [uncultured Kordia sp.]|uniref:hypothetical protein n=1 Tax=uncultured Kordia sp. TaxID=507699 RepID=UPI002617831B|nr:hypothetical protein [uncultured Kordia sp.]
MKNTIYVFLMVLFGISIANATEPVDVANLSIKLSFQKTIDHYYSFEEGDEILFNIEMIKGRHIKSVEITALPSNILLSEFKVSKLVNQKIKIKKKGVVRFRFYSSSLTNRVCRARIQRIPSDVSKIDFNTDWTWKVLKDTTYVKYTQDSLTGYRTVKYQEKVRELKEERLEEILMFDKSERVHSRTNLNNNNNSYLRVSLPNLTNTNYRQEKLLSWAYWIGVGEASQQAYQKNLESVKELAKGVAARYTTPLGALAVGKITDMILPNIGDDVQYYFIPDNENAQKFYNDQQFLQFDMGKGRAAFGRHDQFPKGNFYVGLSNDNLTRGINVNVKIIAVKQVKIFEDVIYDREREEPLYKTLHKTRMKINETRIRVPVE